MHGFICEEKSLEVWLFSAGPEVGLCSEDWRLKSSDCLVVWGAPPGSVCAVKTGG